MAWDRGAQSLLKWGKPLWSVGAAGFAGALVMLVVMILTPNYYVSSARILPAELRGSSGIGGQFGAAAAAFGVMLPGQGGEDSNYPDILASRWMKSRLLAKRYSYWTTSWYLGRRHKVEGTLAEYLKAPNEDLALQQLDRIMAVSRDLKTRMLNVSIETRSPELSQAVLVEMLRLMEDFLHNSIRTRGGAKAAFATQRLKDAQANYSEVEERFRAFASDKRNYQSSADPAIRLGGMKLEAELRLRQQMIANVAVSREQALMDEKNDMPILNVLDSPNLPQLKSRPSRGMSILAVFALCGFTAWCYQNRRWLHAKLIES